MVEKIQGVVFKHLKVAADERGWLMEVLRCDDDVFSHSLDRCMLPRHIPVSSRHGIIIKNRPIISPAFTE